MSKPVNLLDVLLGAGYGMFCTILVLRFLELVSMNVFTVGLALWLATIFFQLFRQERIAKERRETAGSEVANNG